MQLKFQHPHEAKWFLAREKVINQIGILALTLAGVSVSTDAPAFFALTFMLVVLAVMRYQTKSYDRIYSFWRLVRHDLVQTRFVWKYFPLFHIGWLSLALVAAGVVDKTGIVGI